MPVMVLVRWGRLLRSSKDGTINGAQPVVGRSPFPDPVPVSGRGRVTENGLNKLSPYSFVRVRFIEPKKIL